MKFSVVVNTCSMQDRADTHAGPSGKPYSIRRSFIHDIIVPRLVDDPYVAEVVVVGSFEPGDRYTYVPVTETFHNCRDVLAQREAGWQKARRGNPDAVLFLMDDHVPAPGFFHGCHESFVDLPWSVLTPNRRSASSGATLNSGWNGVGVLDPLGRYAHTHGIVLTPEALTKCPWIGLTPLYRFDVLHTMWFADRGLKIHTASNVFVEDLEE